MEEPKKTILIVEDEPALSAAMSDTLTSNGYHTQITENGEEGLAFALKEHPDLLLVDILMPRMDGLQMIEQLRQDEWGRDARVMLLTNLSEEEKIAAAATLGVTDYLVKADWSLKDVVEKIQKAIGR